MKIVHMDVQLVIEKIPALLAQMVIHESKEKKILNAKLYAPWKLIIPPKSMFVIFFFNLINDGSNAFPVKFIIAKDAKLIIINVKSA